MEKELISVIVPIFNASLTLDRCIGSIQKQTYSSIEIVLINDGSTDNSLSICNIHKMYDERIVIIDKKNSGVSEARNDGIRSSTGKYLLFVDADDYIDQDYVETLYCKMLKHNVDIVVSNAIEFTDNGDLQFRNAIKSDTELNSPDLLKELLSEKIFYGVCWGKLFTKKSVANVFFDKNMKIAEDLKFLNDVFVNINKALIIPDRKYHYFVRDGSAIRSGFNEGWLGEIVFCRELVNKHKGTSLERYAIKRYMRVIIHCLYRFDLSLKEKEILVGYTKGFVIKYLLNRDVKIKSKIKYFLSIIKKPSYLKPKIQKPTSKPCRFIHF